MKNLSAGDTVFFVNDLREFGGEETIIQCTVKSLDGQWATLSNGCKYKADHLVTDFRLFAKSDLLKIEVR